MVSGKLKIPENVTMMPNKSEALVEENISIYAKIIIAIEKIATPAPIIIAFRFFRMIAVIVTLRPSRVRSTIKGMIT